MEEQQVLAKSKEQERHRACGDNRLFAGMQDTKITKRLEEELCAEPEMLEEII